MPRPNKSHGESSRRPNLEVLEDRSLPGEALLSVLAAGLVADQFASSTQDFAPPLSQIDASDLSSTTSATSPVDDPASAQTPAADSTAEQSVPDTTTIDTAFISSDEFGLLSSAQLGALLTSADTSTVPPQEPSTDTPTADASGTTSTTSVAPVDGSTSTPSDGTTSVSTQPLPLPGMEGESNQSVSTNDPSAVMAPTFTWSQSQPTVPTLDYVVGQSNVEGEVVSLPITGNAQVPGTLTFAALNLPRGLSIDSNTGVISGTIDYSAAEFAQGQYATTVFASNAEGGSTSMGFGWGIANTVREPVLTNPGNQSSARGSDVALKLVSSQPDNESLLFAATGLPSGLVLDEVDGRIDGTIAYDAGRETPYQVTITVHAQDKSASQTFEWTVPNVNHAPTLDDPGDQFGHAGDDVWLSLTVGDADGDPVTYSATGLPGGLSLNEETGVIEGTILDTAASDTPHSVTFTVSDGTATASRTVFWHVSPLRLDNPDDQTGVSGGTVALQLSAYSVTGATLTYSVAGLPDGTAIDPATGHIAGTISASAVSEEPHAVTVSVSDGTRTESRTFAWTVSRIALVQPDHQENLTGDSVNLPLSASYHGSASLQWSATGLPSGLAIDATTGTIAGTLAVSAAATSPQAVTVGVGDGTSTVSRSFYWTVGRANNQAPVLLNPGSQSGQVGTAVSLQLSASDPEGDSIYYDILGLPEGLEYRSETGLITGAPNFATNFAMVTVTASDLFGGITTESFGWTVAATPGPWLLSGEFRQGIVLGQGDRVLLATIATADVNGFTATADFGGNIGEVGCLVVPLGSGLLGVEVSGFPFTQAGSYPALVRVTGPGASPEQTVASLVEVGDLYAGLKSHLTVTSFGVDDPTAQASEFTATITWGDGNSSAGEVYGGGGRFTVIGEHTYASDSLGGASGKYGVTVTVWRAGQTVGEFSKDVVVVQPQPRLNVSNVLEDDSGTVANQTLAVFTVPNAASTPSRFAATIDWGDQTTSVGIVEGGNGVFRVTGSHQYAEAAVHPVRVALGQRWGAILGPAVLPFVTAVAYDDTEKAKQKKKPEISGGATNLRKVYQGRLGEALLPVYWTIQIPGSKAPRKGTETGGYILQNVKVTYTFNTKPGDDDPRTSPFSDATVTERVMGIDRTRPAAFRDFVPDFLSFVSVNRRTGVFTFRTDYWEAWPVPKDAVSPDQNWKSVLNPGLKQRFANTFKFTDENAHDLYWTPQFNNITAGSIQMDGKVIYLDGLKELPAYFDTYELGAFGSPAGGLPSFSAIDPSTGRQVEEARLIERLIRRHPEEKKSERLDHVLHVKWNKDDVIEIRDDAKVLKVKGGTEVVKKLVPHWTKSV